MNSFISLFTSGVFGFVLKLLSGIAAAGFGILGIGTKTRDDDGNLTRDGKIALIGILVSAIIAGAATVYDYASDEKKSDEANANGQRLLLSVRRGLYPFRGLTLEMTVQLNDSVPGVKRYARALTQIISRDPDCDHPEPYKCTLLETSIAPAAYRIELSSTLFPNKKTLLYGLIERLGVGIKLAQKNRTTDQKHGFTYTAIGDFDAVRRGPMPDDTELLINSEHSILVIERFPIEDSDSSSSTVLSLVDVMPGAIGATAILDCISRQYRSAPECSHDSVRRTEDGSSVYGALITFSYPKSVRMRLRETAPCHDGQHLMRVKILPSDIDDGTSNGPKEDMNVACDALKKPSRWADLW